jgi:branched-chain amino acid transport system permease protein
MNLQTAWGQRRYGIPLLLWAVLVTLPWWLRFVGSYSALGSKILIYGLATMGLNILFGFTGGLSFGQAAYFGIGAYGAGLTLKYISPSTPLAILVGTLAGGLAAAILGPLVMRRRGIYFAMITIAIGQLFYFVAVRWNTVTGGEDGLAGFERQPIHFGRFTLALNQTHFYYLVLLCFTIGVILMRALLRSPLGHTWVAIRENRRRMEFLGVRTDLYVWAAFAIAGLVTALAGTLNALLFNFTSPQDLHWILSGDFVMMIVLGGMRNFWGPLLGTAIFVVAQDYLSSITGNWMTFIGLIFVGIVLLFPKGLLGMVGRGKASDVDTDVPERVAFPPITGGPVPDAGVAKWRQQVELLRLEHVSRHFGALHALDDVSFEMCQGELRAVIGQNGAGKTTFFNLISGFLPASGGELWFAGENIGRRTVVRRVAGGIVRTFQITEVFPDLTVFESIRVAVEAATRVNRWPWLPRSTRRALDQRVAEVLDAVDLTGKAHRVVGELAHGDQRAVEIAMALCMRPQLLLLDEPTAGMSDAETEHMVRLICRLHKEHGLSILLIEHDMDIVFEIAERITVLDHGRKIAEGLPEEISANAGVRAAYLGEAA